MEDEKGLDLSLSLPCGGGSSSQKGNYSIPSDIRSDEGDRDMKLINEFKNFLEGGTQQHHSKVDENIYNSFGKNALDVETSKNSNSGGLWNIDSRSAETEDERRSGVGEKRKSFFAEVNHQKKLDRETSNLDLADKAKASHISITTDEGSTAENEDVGDSEVDGSTSKHVSQNDEVSRRFVSSGGLSRSQKDAFGDSSGVEILGQKRYTITSEKEFNMTNKPVSYSVPLPGQPVNMSYTQPGNNANSSGGTPSLSSYPLPGVKHTMPGPNGERPNVQPVMQSNFPLMFGYNPVQLPALDRDNSRGIVSHHVPSHPAYTARNPSDTHNDNRKQSQVSVPVLPHKSSESTQYDGRLAEHGKSNRKQHGGEEGSSSHREGELKGNHAIHQVRDPSDPPRAETPPTEYPAIRPGIAADLKFGGCGSYPNLPWVSTTGTGPHGRTISGVTYRFSATQIRIVCACHGSHLSPEEFVRHASDENFPPSTGTGLASVPSTNPAASAHG